MAYVTVDQLAKKLNKSPRTVTSWVKRGIAYPVNPDTYRRDGGYVFTQAEISRLRSLFSKLSLKNAANLVGITPQYLNQLALNGEINSELITYGNQRRRQFYKEDCLRLKERIENQEHTRTTQKYGKRVSTYYNGIRLFEKIMYDGEKARVVGTNPLRVLKWTGEYNVAELPNHYSDPWPEVPYQRKKGTITFRFQVPGKMDHPLYDLLYKMVYSLGEKNVRLFERDGFFTILCRQGRFVGTEDEYSLLLNNVVEKQVSKDGEYIVFHTSKRPVTIDLPEALIKEINERAKESNRSFEEVIIQLIQQGKVALEGKGKFIQ